MFTMICRVCLVGNIRMRKIEDVQLKALYENVTNTKFIEDGMPNKLCYICYRQLQKCCVFYKNAHRSERTLRNLLRSCTEISRKTISDLKLETTQNLSATSPQCFSIDPDNDNKDSPLSFTGSELNLNCAWMCNSFTVKEEIAVKEEKPKEEIFIEIKNTVNNDESIYIKGNELDKEMVKQNDSKNTELNCDKCDKKFKNTRCLKAHMITHKEGYSCDKCSKRFKQKSNYKLHLRNHTDGKPFPCLNCPKTFYRLSNLNKHIQTHTQEKSYICDRCSKKFKQRSHLKVHMRIHTGEKSYACEICGKFFNQIANLNKHIGIHTGIKPFSCEICGKAFLQRAQVKAHLRSHTGEKPYTCNSCNMAFSHANPLRKHLKLHTEAKEHICDVCYLSYNEESSLIEHKRIHTTERPYVCEKCSHSFTDKRNLKRHEIQVHCEERQHTCTRCGKTFKRPQHLKKHMTSTYLSTCSGVKVKFDGNIDIGPKWSYEIKPVLRSDTNKQRLHLVSVPDIVSKMLEKYAPKSKEDEHNFLKTTLKHIEPYKTKSTRKKKGFTVLKSVTESNKDKMYVEPMKVRNDSEIIEFTRHMFAEYLKMFDVMRAEAESELMKEQIDVVEQMYMEKFVEFVRYNQDQIIKTHLGRQKVIMNTLETSNLILKRLINYLIRPDNNSLRNEAISNIFQNEVNKKMDIENTHICKKFGICRSQYGYTNFLIDLIDIILSANDRKIKEAADAVTEVAKYTDFSRVMNSDTKKNFNKGISDIESYDVSLLKPILSIVKNVLHNKNKPIKVIGTVDKRVNKTVGALEMFDALDKALPPNEKNLLEWEDIKNSLTEWRDLKRNDILEITQSFFDNTKTGFDSLDEATAKNFERNINLLLGFL